VTASAADQQLLQAFALHQQGRLVEAGQGYREVLEQQPEHFDALHLLGLLALQTHEPERALELIGRAVLLNPALPAAHLNHGAALAALRRHAEALASYERALALDPAYADAQFNRANALRELGQAQAAADGYGRACQLRPDLTEAHYQRGRLLHQLGQSEAAIGAFDRALALRPHAAEVRIDRGVALYALRRLPAALADFSHAAELEPRNAAVHHYRGLTLHALQRCEEALFSYDRSIALRADFADVHNDRAVTLFDLRDFGGALRSYERARTLDPDAKYLDGTCLHLRMKLCEWRGYDAALAHLGSRLERGEPAAPAFATLTLTDSAALQRKAAEVWVRAESPPLAELPPFGTRTPQPRIRVGYFSADFHAHATMHLMAGLFECHDRGRFEVSAFSFGPASRDALRRRAELACEHFIDVREKTDLQIAHLARGLGLDIAVDLKGFTQNARPGVFALRAAPVQVSYLGYPGTLGADYMDYLVADAIVVPEAAQAHYREQLIYLPGSYQVNDARREPAGEPPPRAELGLPQSAVVLACFNDGYKITPAVFERWMRILRRVPDAVLWLLEDNATAAENLRREATERGVGAARLVFAPRIAHGEHLARQRAADLFLDTLPCNAHTTASDALWAGVPLVTCTGEAFAARVAASALTAAGLAELVTHTLDDYEALAVALASDRARREGLRTRLAAARSDCALFDTRAKTRQLEAAFDAIHARALAGLPPQQLRVPVG
jgi:predicted O-linked N-acetylglucosamine transferase (SPINDLY family)